MPYVYNTVEAANNSFHQREKNLCQESNTDHSVGLTEYQREYCGMMKGR